MVKQILEIIIIIIDNVLLIELLHVFCKPKNKTNFNILILAILISENIFYKFMAFNLLSNLLPIITIAIYCSFFLNGSLLKKIISVSFVFANMIVFNSFFIMIGSLFTPSAYAMLFDSNNNISYYLVFVNKLFVFLEIQYFNNFYKTDLELSFKIWKYNLIILVVSIISIFIALNEYVFRGASIFYIGITIITFVLLNVLVFSLCLTLSKQNIEKANQDIYIQSLEYEEKILKVTSQMTQELQSANHDFKHHMTVIKKMIEENNSDITKYLTEISLSEKSDNNIIHTNNPVLNYILNEKIETANKYNIIVDKKIIGIDSNNDYIDNIDLSIILGNLLDNAIESCNKLYNNKFINIEISIDDNKTIIIIENPSTIKYLHTNEVLITTKKDNVHQHGFGMNNVKNSVDKYNGELNYYIVDYVFAIHCIIPNIHILDHEYYY